MVIRFSLRTHPYGLMGSSNNQRCGDSTGTYNNRNPAPNSSQYTPGDRVVQGCTQSIDGGTHLVPYVGAADPEDDIPGDVGGVIGYALERSGDDDRVQSLQADLRVAFHHLHQLGPGNAVHVIDLIIHDDDGFRELR